MKKTQRKDAFRGIVRRVVSWLSIVTIVLLGVGIVLGISFTGIAIRDAAASYYARHGFRDFDVTSASGLSEKDVTRIRGLEGVLDAEGAIMVNAGLEYGEQSLNIRILSRTERVSAPWVKEGAFPTEANECLVGADLGELLGLSVGDTVRVEVQTQALAGALRSDTFTITGFGYHPDYLMLNKTYYIILPPSAFDTAITKGAYTDVLVDAELPEGVNSFLRGYMEAVTPVREELVNLENVLGDELTEQIYEEGQKQLEEARTDADRQLEEARQQISEGEERLERELKQAEEQIMEGEKTLSAGRIELEEELAKAEEAYVSGEKRLSSELAKAMAQIRDGERTLQEKLAEASAELEAKEAEYAEALAQFQEKEAELNAAGWMLADAEQQLADGRNTLDSGWGDYQAGVAELDQRVDELADRAGDILDGMGRSEERAALDAITAGSGVERGERILELMDTLSEVDDNDMLEGYREELSSALDQLEDASGTLSVGESEYAGRLESYEGYLAQYRENEALLEQARWRLQQGRNELDIAHRQYEEAKANGEAELKRAREAYAKSKADGEKRLAQAREEIDQTRKEKEAELADGEKKVSEGYAEYERQKAAGEAELADAQKRYEEGEKEAEERLADAEAKLEERLEEREEPHIIIQDIQANDGYVAIESPYRAISRLSLFMTPLFAVIAGLVCFSTISIIIEEQKKQVGVVKAFGFHDREVRAKYMIFGVSAVVIGVLLGLGAAWLIQDILLKTVAGRYYGFGNVDPVYEAVPAILVGIVTVAMACTVIFFSCRGLISCSAIGLLNGTEPVKRTIRTARKNTERRGSLYSRLIINNAVTDIGRVVVSVVVITGSCLMIGASFSIKMAFEKALDRQSNEVMVYDLQVSCGDGEAVSRVEEVLAEYGATYLPIRRTGVLCEFGNEQVGMNLVCADSSRIGEYVVFRDAAGHPVELPDSGVIVPYHMVEKRGAKPGVEMRLQGADMRFGSATVTGSYISYVGINCVFMSEAAYEEIYACPAETNAWLVYTEGADEAALTEALMSASDAVSVERADAYRRWLEPIKALFMAAVLMMVILAVIMTFMIQINLTNILVNRRMKELLVMRVNGFTMRQVIGYLARETAFVTALGIVLGILIGVPFAAVVERGVEPIGIMMVRTPFALAWVYAAGFCILFSVTIGIISFRRIRKVPLTDVTR